MNLVIYKVVRDNVNVKLSHTKFILLRFFLENIDRVFTCEQLLNYVWKNNVFVELRSVEVYIRHLRKSLNFDNKTDYIRTVRSAEYCFGS